MTHKDVIAQMFELPWIVKRGMVPVCLQRKVRADETVLVGREILELVEILSLPRGAVSEEYTDMRTSGGRG